MKKPCDTCKVCATYYEYPCYGCSHNPHSPEEILENWKEEIFNPRMDRYKKENLSGEVAKTMLIKEDGMSVYECGSCKKEFLTSYGNERKTLHCPECGSKINY